MKFWGVYVLWDSRNGTRQSAVVTTVPLESYRMGVHSQDWVTQTPEPYRTVHPHWGLRRLEEKKTQAAMSNDF